MSVVSKTALLVFVKFPEPGKVKTRLASAIGADQAAAIYRLIAETCLQRYQSIPNTDCIVYYAPAEEKDQIETWLGQSFFYEAQPDGGLGERLQYGFQRCLPRYKKVIALGTDSPDLPLAYIEKAIASLEDHDAVAGPSGDGGYYLIGMNADCTFLFDDIEWSTNQVLYQTLMKAKDKGISMDIMPPWYDVDTIEELHKLLQGGKPLIPKINAILNYNLPEK